MQIKSNHVAKFILERRKEKSIGQQKLQELIFEGKRSGQFISNIERGKCQLPSKHIRKIAEILEVEADQIVDLLVADYKEAVVKGL